MGVNAIGIDAQLVAVLARQDEPCRAVPRLLVEHLAQTGDVDLHRLRCGRGRRLLPELVDQPLGAQALVGVKDKQREQRPLLASAEGDRPVSVKDLECAKDAEVH